MAALGSAGARLGGDAGIKEWRVERGEVMREQTAPVEGDEMPYEGGGREKGQSKRLLLALFTA